MRALVTLLFCLFVTNALALPTVENVQDAVRRGDYASAEGLVREVLVAKPENARAHYLLAEILAHEGHIVEARRQAGMAQQNDPQIRFTTPERFHQFEESLAKASAERTATAAAPARPAEPAFGGGGAWLLVLLGAGALYFFLRRRPAAQTGYVGYGSPAVPPADPSYRAPGYPPAGAYPPGYPNAPRSGVGASVAAGLGGLATGMLVEHLLEGATDHHHDNAGALVDPAAHDAAPADAFRDQPIDFGNGSDWDSGGGGDGGGFDSGGGGDW